MNREHIDITSKEQWLSLRAKNLNSTDVAALFDLNPYCTILDLWHQKKLGVTTSIEENERMRIGSKVESVIANEVADRNGWKIKPMKWYTQIKEQRLGSSFDFMIVEPFEGIIECKNVDYLVFRDDWDEDDDGNIEAPPHIEIQSQMQLYVSGLERLWIGVMIGGNQIKYVPRTRHEGIISEIVKRSAQFWDSIDRGEPPKPDFTRDSEFIISMNQFAKGGTTIDERGNAKLLELAHTYHAAQQREKAAQAEKDAAKAEMLTLIGENSKVFLDEGLSITASMVAATEVPSYTRDAYRLFKVNKKKGKQNGTQTN